MDGAAAGSLLGGYDKERVLYACNVPTTSNEALSCKYCCRTKAINITYSECMSGALIIQHVINMRPVILFSVAYLTVPYFSTYLINGTIFGGKNC
jgi:hypothetical protein